MRLNLGAGETKIEGYTNVDYEAFPGVDIVSKIDNLSFAKDGEIEEIYASNVIEHLSFKEIPNTLKEWGRVMKSGGKLFISVPDMLAINEYINRNGWDEWICYIVYGGTDTYKDCHRSGFDFNMMSNYLEVAGFKNIYKVDKFPQGLIDCSQCTSRDYLHSKTELIVLNVIAEKA